MKIAFVAGPLLLGAVAVTVPVAASAQEEGQGSSDPGQELVFTSRWEVGDRHRMELTKEREQFRGAQRLSGGGSTTEIDVEVVAAGDSGFVLRWTFGRSRLSLGVPPQDRERLEQLANLTGGLVLDLRTDSRGVPVEVANALDVAESYRGAVARLRGWMHGQDIPEEEIDPVLKSLQPLTRPRDAALISLREPAILYAAQGRRFPLGEKVEYPGELPNALGGDPFPSRAWYLLRELRLEEDTALLRWSQQLDPDKFPAALAAAVREFAAGRGLPEPEPHDYPKLEVEDIAEFVLEVKSGWPIQLDYRRTAVSGPDRQIERLRFRRIAEDPKR